MMIVGRSNVVIAPAALRPFCTGYRTGIGPCLAAVRPGTLVELWRVLGACVAADCAVIMQAANTGLTGGSTPTRDYDRNVVIISTLRIKGVKPILGGNQVICLAGATLDELERALAPLGREPHSVIGSSCIGASVIGGVCNNSGGALVRRGPAYTELALYARLDERGHIELVNHLGVRLEGDPEAMLRTLEQPDADLDALLTPTNARACDDEYDKHVRNVDAPSPARFNADPRRLHEASGSAGKVVVFAVRLATFAPEPSTSTFYIGVTNPDDLTWLRRQILAEMTSLPLVCEYMHRDAFDLAARYGKDTFLAIRWLGTGRLGLLNRVKNGIDQWSSRFGASLISDKLLQTLAELTPPHLPRRLRQFRDRYSHHLVLKVPADARAETEAMLQDLPSPNSDYFECRPTEAACALLHRFVIAGAAVRCRAVRNDIEDIVALDFALKRNERAWVERLPPEIESELVGKLYYGHFLCHVFHHDYLVRKGSDAIAVEHEMCALLDQRGAEYPAERNVGHLYRAKPSLESHYRALDPCNVFNPGVGQLSKRRNWA